MARDRAAAVVAGPGPYGRFMPARPNRHGELTARRRNWRASWQGVSMGDAIHLLLGLAGFLAFALAVRAAGRL